jgi:GH35 family endo-1,4-beta-xylanase
MTNVIRLAVATVLISASVAIAQTSLTGAELAVQSDGTPDGKLERNGYVGTFIRVPTDADVTIKARASGTSADGTAASLSLSVADDSVTVAAGDEEIAPHVKTHLPAGTYFVRVQLGNAPLAGKRTLSIESLFVDGATFANENNDANALAAADTYIEHYRKGEATLTIKGVEPGTPVHVKLKHHAFNFGVAVSGYERSMHMDVNAPADSDAAKYRAKVRELFNLIVPGNAGKWAYNEKDRGTPTMEYIDQLRAFAKDHHQQMRMHTLLWDTDQQPQFVRDLLTKAAAGDAAAKADLRRAISDRIKYYVADRAGSYEEMDVINEAYHQPRYWNIFGAEGVADIFKEVDNAVTASGANTRLCVNEYNIFQWSQTPPYGPGAKGAPDLFANWYREHVEQIRAAGGPVTGIGVQYYTDVRPEIPQPHSVARINQVFQNLSVSGLPISLTEFGVNALPKRPTPPTKEQTDAAMAKAGQVIDESMRMAFGTPSVTTFICWGFWAGDVWEQAPYGVLFDKEWNLTPAGRAFLALREKWDTDVTLPAAADQTIKLNGFYGDYEVSAGGKAAVFTLKRDGMSYTVEIK